MDRPPISDFRPTCRWKDLIFLSFLLEDDLCMTVHPWEISVFRLTRRYNSLVSLRVDPFFGTVEIFLVC